MTGFASLIDGAIFSWLPVRHGRSRYSRAGGFVAQSEGIKDDPVKRTGVRKQVAAKQGLTAIGFDRGLRGSGRLRLGESAIIVLGFIRDPKDHPTLLPVRRLRERQQPKTACPRRRHTVEPLGLEGSVIMPGFVPNPHVYRENADLFLLSSAWDCLGGVLISAGERPAILEISKYGRLVPMGDLEAPATAMTEARDEPHDCKMLGSREKQASVERAADQYVAPLNRGEKILAAK
jgi:hypothetical protein